MKKSRRSSEAIQSVEDVPPRYEYDVFLSFRGPDTRSNFTDCLYYRLRHAGVHVFLDNEELRVGKEIGGELLKALDKSRIYIPIFSQNYATSSWCLREVAHMVEGTSKSKGKKEILPIFYDVDPEDIKLRTNLYRKALPKHKKKFGSDALKRWEDALVQVAHLKGWELKGKGQGELIELVVGEVLCKLNDRNVDVPEYWVEDHRQIEDILKKLEVNSNGVRFFGIHGIGGIGKTVLAKVVFNKISSHFDGVCFLNNVRESSQHGLINVQKKLLSSFVGSVIAEYIKDIGDGMILIKRVCHTKKVLIVLDDLDKQEQLKKLAGKSNWFGSGSRIIFTTRNLEVLMTQVESSSAEVLNQPEGILAYEVQEMEFGRALQLFCKHAFKRDFPLEGCDHLAKKIVRRVGMLPLAVEVIGSFLYCHHSAVEQHFDKRKLWEDTLKQLDEGPFKDVRDALMISYKGMEDKQKKVFLDIACFFTNEDQAYPLIMWDDCNYHAYSAISVLLLRSLIKIVHDNKFWMHDQVRDLGRSIILEEHPCKISRVWIHEDAVKLLEKKERNQEVEALSLICNGYNRNIVLDELVVLANRRFLRVEVGGNRHLRKLENHLFELFWLSGKLSYSDFFVKNFHLASLIKLHLIGTVSFDERSQFQRNEDVKALNLTSDGYSQNIVPEELAALPNLRFLQLKGIEFVGNFENLVLKLRWLSWEVTHNNFYAENFHFANLVILDLSRSNIKDDWGGWRQFQITKKLKVLDLTSCTKLTRTPDFTNFMSLEILNLAGCVKLITIDHSICKLEFLETLNIEGCKSLGKLPEEIGSLPSLMRIVTDLRTGFKGHMGTLEELIFMLETEVKCLTQISLSLGVGLSQYKNNKKWKAKSKCKRRKKEGLSFVEREGGDERVLTERAR